MKNDPVTVKRETKETQIQLSLTREGGKNIEVNTGIPFMDHLLTAFAFHGGFDLGIQAAGDIDVDPHHLVEDLGLVLGEAFHKVFETQGPVSRYGNSLLSMDDALCEAVIDVCERPYLVYRAEFPQPFIGNFSVALLKEFFYAFSHRARINIHLWVRYGENSHHIAECLLKTFGKALAQAYKPVESSRGDLSTKGAI